MASCQTTQWVDYSPYVKLTVTQSSSTDTTATLSWTLQYIAEYAASSSVAKAYTVTIGGEEVKSGTYSINGKTGTNTIASGTKQITKTTSKQTISFSVSFGFNLTWSGSYKGTLSASGSISVAKKTSYTVSYNLHGGSGTSSSQTKWHDTDITLHDAPKLNGYSFGGWATTAGGSKVYDAGAPYSENANVTLHAIWTPNTYTVTYNANGGSLGKVSATQTKTHGVDLPLDTEKPTRQNYNFLGWGTSASTTAVSYAAGESYKQNANITLFAVWELAYTRPRIDELSITRCDSAGTASDEGTSALLAFIWECDQTVSSIAVEWECETGGAGTAVIDASGTSGSVNEVIESGYFSTDSTYTVKVTVTDGGGYTSVFGTIAGTKFPLDLKAGGNGIAFGKPAELDGVADIGFQTRFQGGILHPVIEPDMDLDDVLTPNTYIGANVTTYNYGNCPLNSGTFTLSVESAGNEGQLKQILTRCSKTEPERYIRFYYQGAWNTDWIPDAPATIYVKKTGTDLNDYVASGVYYFNSSHTPTNIPTTDSIVNAVNPTNGWLIVLRADSGAIKQFFCRYGTAGTNDYQVWVRTGNGSTWGIWSRFSNQPVTLYYNSSGSAGTITLSESAANFDYLEIIFCDNNGIYSGYTKTINPNGKQLNLSTVEGYNARTWIRRTTYYCSGTSLAPSSVNQGYALLDGTTVYKHDYSANFLKIQKVLGHRA